MSILQCALLPCCPLITQGVCWPQVRRAEEEHFRDCSPEELVEQLLTRY